MDTRLQPGELVVRRIRWGVHAQQLGLVIGCVGFDEWLVMWVIDSPGLRFDMHLGDALLVIDDDNMAHVGDRCRLGT